MNSVAVFVDAGYLFAQGSVALTGSQKPRHELSLNEAAVIGELTHVAHTRSNGMPLLRIYWYDAARSGRSLTLDHLTLAHSDYVKLRLGFMNSQQQQKGVDSLIVTDLIELARNRAMVDAILVSGDEDVRIGVTIAQSFGVRIHLLGIKPSRGSQSPQLMQEADTTTEWDATVVGRFLAHQASAPAESMPMTAGATQAASAVAYDFETIVTALVATLNDAEIQRLLAFWETATGLPPELDGKLLARCRAETGADLDPSQKRLVRRRFRSAVEAAKPQ